MSNIRLIEKYVILNSLKKEEKEKL